MLRAYIRKFTMKKRSYAYQIVLYVILSCSLISGKNFILDFGGVLVLPDKFTAFQHLGMTNIAECIFCLRLNPLTLQTYLKTVLFNTLDAIAQSHDLNTNSYHLTYDEKGNPLPFLMCAWLQGSMPCSEIRLLINNSIALHPEWFKCRAEQRLIENILQMIFTPQYFVNTWKISTAGIAFIKQCKLHGHKIYGLSNWDAESFALLKQKHPQLFELFDGVVASGEVNANKPHATIYQILLERYQLDPQQCLFIDDQKENVAAAQKLGINAFLYESSFKKVIQNIKLAYSKSVTRRENFKNSGIIETKTNITNNAIIDGENISRTDSTI